MFLVFIPGYSCLYLCYYHSAKSWAVISESLLPFIAMNDREVMEKELITLF
ncbi:unnamed protein product, partial [Amoebophrya sp. A120]